MKGRYGEGKGSASRTAPEGGWKLMVRVISSCLAGDDEDGDSPLCLIYCIALIEMWRVRGGVLGKVTAGAAGAVLVLRAGQEIGWAWAGMGVGMGMGMGMGWAWLWGWRVGAMGWHGRAWAGVKWELQLELQLPAPLWDSGFGSRDSELGVARGSCKLGKGQGAKGKGQGARGKGQGARGKGEGARGKRQGVRGTGQGARGKG